MPILDPIQPFSGQQDKVESPKLLEESCSAESPLACPVLVLPHTSGVSHFWNEPQNVRLAEDAFRRAMARHMS